MTTRRMLMGAAFAAAAALAQTSAAPELRGSSWRVKWMGKRGEKVEELRSYDPVLEFYRDGRWFLSYDTGTFRGGRYSLSGPAIHMVNDDGTAFLSFEAEWNGAEKRLILRSGEHIWRLEYRRATQK